MTNAERQKRYREKHKTLRLGAVEGQSVTAGVMGVTDALFEAAKPGYYIFEYGEPWARECWECRKKFETRLELNKFCSPACKEKYLRESMKAKIRD